MKLNIFKETGGRLPTERLQRMFAKLSAEEKRPGWAGQVNLVYTDDAGIRKLNKEFRRIDKRTDVLAFNIDHPNNDDAVFGEVYVSVPTATRQADEDGVTLIEELVRLSCHGMLHLFGYDHARRREAEQMRALEDYFVDYSKRTDNG